MQNRFFNFKQAADIYSFTDFIRAEIVTPYGHKYIAFKHADQWRLSIPRKDILSREVRDEMRELAMKHKED